MLRIATIMTGDDYAVLRKDTPESRRKVIGLALAMTIPVIIWFVSGFMLSSRVLQMSEFNSLLTAICCSLIVFLMEKLVVMSKGGPFVYFFRGLIALILAMLGSLSIDEVVFHEDIGRSVERLRVIQAAEAADSARLLFERMNGYEEVRNRIRHANDRYEAAEADVIGEANGTYGTGRSGVGRITALKDRKADARKRDLEELNAGMATLESKKALYIENERQQALQTFSPNGLLTRIKALADLVKSDPWVRMTYIAFTSLMLLIEFLVVIFKSTWPKTNYERRLEMIEQIGDRRMKLLMTDGSPVYDPNHTGREVSEARRFIEKPICLT